MVEMAGSPLMEVDGMADGEIKSSKPEPIRKENEPEAPCSLKPDVAQLNGGCQWCAEDCCQSLWSRRTADSVPCSQSLLFDSHTVSSLMIGLASTLLILPNMPFISSPVVLSVRPVGRLLEGGRRGLKRRRLVRQRKVKEGTLTEQGPFQ